MNDRLSYLIAIFFTAITFFVGICELFFWNEFRSRFNFIAVDYLIYTSEVLNNVWESFPLGWVSFGITFSSLLLTFLTFKIPFKQKEKSNLKLKSGRLLLLWTGFILGGSYIATSPALNQTNGDFRQDQITRNGWIEFIRAFRSNSIDYKAFYRIIPDSQAEDIVKKKIEKRNTVSDIYKTKPHVVIIVIESLGAKFIEPLGGEAGLTPFLNRLSSEAIFFEKLYATGTRTVRGLEAINLSVPPTPGYAVIKRPDHKNLYSLGNTFKSNGYEPTFLYGGRGFFDNMNSFFSGNGFTVVDQNDYKPHEVSFKNAWGVCDEDLFSKAIQVMDQKSTKQQQLLFLLTTSNHRPFTYPDGKIDIPSGTGRAGAVKYTDFAIGKFITEALNKSWGKDTIFVIVSDHSTEGRGQFELEIDDFHVPMWIYDPGKIFPQKFSRVVSQIDILPSLIHLLGLTDTSPFFGQNMFQESFEERAFIGNYQFVGYFRDNILTTLGPNRTNRNYRFEEDKNMQVQIESSPHIQESIAFFQYASNLLSTGRYKAR